MTTLSKLQRYEDALRKWKKAKAEHDVANGSERPEPPPAEFMLRSGTDKWAAKFVREKVLGRQ